MMNLHLNPDQTMLRDTFSQFFSAESTMERVRAAEPLGFDKKLWQDLAGLGIIPLRAPESMGGGLGLMEALLLMEEAGRHLASAPIAEAVVCTRILALIDHPCARTWFEQVAEGAKVVTLALVPLHHDANPLLPAGAIADGVLVLDGQELLLIDTGGQTGSPANLGDQPIARRELSRSSSEVIASGSEAVALYNAAIEEWKLLTAAQLASIGSRAIEIAAEYASERTQFGKTIGSYQAISHPLADLATDMLGASLLARRTVCALASGEEKSAALVSMSYTWAAQASGKAVARAMQTMGGYGLSLEYDVQLYHRRAKAIALLAGDPADGLQNIGARLWLAEKADIPETIDPGISFDFGAEATALAQETREFFERTLTPELKQHCHHSFDGHVPEVHKALGDARLLFPSWPIELGGRACTAYEAIASEHVWDEFDWTINAVAVANMVGRTVMWFGTDELKQEALPRIGSGDAICSLGYTEPASGSDVFAAKTQAVKDGEEWVINGQKIFTSGANIAQYVLLLTRTDPDAPKHKGITMFLVPLDSPGIEIHAVHTYPDERTNITYYSDVRVSDKYRLGEVNGGSAVLAAALKLEQGGAGFIVPHKRVLNTAVKWARDTERNGRPAIENPQVLARLSQVAIHTEVSDLIFRNSLWSREEGLPDRALGPMSKMFSTEAFLRDSTDLLNLTAPESLLRGNTGLGMIERSHRHGAATTIYGGTSEIQRSQVAERYLGLPRSR